MNPRKTYKSGNPTKLKYVLAGVIALSISTGTWAFDIKGISAGMEVTQELIKDCSSVRDADSGIPGYRCVTTLAGESAQLRIAVFDKKIVALIFSVKNAQMGPVKDALVEKYGRPYQHNRYIEDYSWSRDRRSLSIKQNRITRGYSVLLVDFVLYDQARSAAKNKAKQDL